MEAVSDIRLVAQVAVMHNRRAFDQLVRKYQSPVRRFLLHLTAGNEALSDDLAQDTFLKAYTAITQFKGSASFRTWLLRIAYRTFIDDRRKRAAIALPPDGLAAVADAASAGGKPSGTLLDVARAMQTLSPDERTCVTLQLIEGYAVKEIASIVQMPENTVKSHLKRGKEKLTTYLKNNGYD